MSTKDMVYNIIENMTEEQLQALLVLLGGYSKNQTTTDSVQGILSKYANKDLIPLEEGAWERNINENYENS